MAKDTHQAFREVCLSFPEAEEYLSHGAPNFRVRRKTFATYVLNHHGDGCIALWLNAPAGAQEYHTRSEPKHFFVPPYVGPRGAPVWRAGSKAFALIHARAAAGAGDGSGRTRLRLHFRVGVDAQSLMTTDGRFEVPPYMGYNGWIALDVTDGVDWDEVRGLALGSYRHFALKRMLSRLK